MNNNTHERFPIGNGNFYTVIQGLSIKEIRISHTSPSSCTLEFLKDEPTLFTKSQRIYGSTRWHTRLLRVVNQGENDESLVYCTEVDDRFFPDCDVFIRSIKTRSVLNFKLVLPDQLKIAKAPSVSYGAYRTESYWIKRPYTNHEEILEISLCGECHLNSCNMTLSISPGESSIIISMGTIPTIIQKNTSKTLRLVSEEKLPELPILFNEDGVSKIRNSLFAITTHLINKRGITAGSNDPYIRMLPLYAVIKLLNRVEMQRLACAIATNGLKSFLSVKDCVALGENNEPQYATDIFSLTPSLLMLSALEAPNEKFLKGVISYLTTRCRLQSRTLINGMLPFEGREYYYNKLCPITDGSAVSTLFFIKCIGEVCKNTEDKELSEALKTAKASFRDNFITQDAIYLNSPKRSQASRFPKFIYGICDFCEKTEFTWLTKNNTGAYCCDECAEKYKSQPPPHFGVRKESYLPALWAVYLDMEIFTAEEIGYSQDLAVRELKNIPLYDVALLLISMKKYPHRAKQQVYDLIMSKRNSLGIWYSCDGNFDTLTNALCADAVIDVRKNK